MKASINKNLAPSDYKKFKRWYKTACSLDMTADEAYKSLGYKLPKKDVREDSPVKKK